MPVRPLLTPITLTSEIGLGQVGGGALMVIWCVSTAEPPQFCAVTVIVFAPVVVNVNGKVEPVGHAG